MRALVVEDEPELARQLSQALENDGYAVDVAGDGEQGHYLGEVEPYDIVVLDLGLPLVDGLTVLERWREAQRLMPVLILTARDAWREKVAAFDAGADDYVTKPFRIEEVLARVRALIRRSTGHASAVIECGRLAIDTSAARVLLDGKAIKFTAQEYKVLSYLLHHRGRVISRTELTEHVYDQEFDLDSNTIEVFIGRIRRKVGSEYIATVRGLGYRMVVPGEND